MVRLIPVYVFLLVFYGYVGWNWIRWARRKEDPAVSNWRIVIVLVGFGLATLSAALDLFLTLHALFTGGYDFYHPVEMFCIRLGSLASVLGLVAAVLGKGRARVATAVASFVTLLLWFVDAATQ
jgi:hypothetical protein